MEHLRLLIVDDIEDNRLILKAICRKMEGFEIREACDGIEAIEMAEQWHPHIVLMDIMMPRMDGFEASKIIKERYPDTVIMAVTAVIDPHMEENMASIGVAAYIRKPIDKDLIRFKLQSFGAVLRSKEGEYKILSHKEALNPFCSDIRHFKTIFDIVDPDAMMDFGMWILARCDEKMVTTCTKVDAAIELFYELMRQGTRNGEPLSIIIEESFEEIFVTMKFEGVVDFQPKAMMLLQELGPECIAQDNIACVRIRMRDEGKKVVKKEKAPPAPAAVIPTADVNVEEAVVVEVSVVEEPMEEAAVAKETRIIHSDEQQLLRQSFVHKTTSREYIQDIGGDVLDEIRDLVSLDEEWADKLRILEDEHTPLSIRSFVDGVLGVYVHAINNLFEFTALAYALSSLGAFLKENADAIIADPEKLKKLVMMMEHLGADLTSWRSHIFELQDAGDIHYLDSSFFSSCMQIEGLMSDKEVTGDDDNDMEFF